ncbi:OmpA family protein [Gynurincola endophyticus]|uniref:OmpA family protein n=1 Tax=Gynurincola endophyticus TaxID=2479004 RepID=UPI000F8D818B|nr:OmpA family protein [Gynurincola endophyticus]
MKKWYYLLIAILVTSNAFSQEKSWDTRWFVAPGTKFQFQEFGMLEKKQYGNASNATDLKLSERGNFSIMASAYKNFSGFISASFEAGISKGRFARNGHMIGTSDNKTLNMIGANLYFHLLPARNKVQPYVTVGVNNMINDESFTSVPAGVGVKYTGRKMMFLAQGAYGHAISANANKTMFYTAGLHIAINNKKSKKSDKDKDASTSKKDKKKDKDEDNEKSSKKDTTIQNITNNFYINLNLDSIVNERVKGLEQGAGNGTKRNGYRDEYDVHGNILEMFDNQDYRVETVDGKTQTRFVVYFYYDDYSITSKAFQTIDKIVAIMKSDPKYFAEVKGHTDNVGSQEFNLNLSKKRAQMVYDYMNSRGIGSDRLLMLYYGKEEPVADNADMNKVWLNRRAEIILKTKD